MDYIRGMDAKKFRVSLINAATPAETKLLQMIDSNVLLKGKVLFQHHLKPYFVDFYFPSKKLAVEVDGSSHKDKFVYDKKGSRYILREFGVKIIRVSNSDVFKNPDLVISKIIRYSMVKAKIKNKRDFYGVNPVAVPTKKKRLNLRGELKAHRKRNTVAKRAVMET